MAVEVKVPSLGLAIEEATLAQWLKEEGDEVQEGEAIASMTTDKVSYEVVAPEAGVLLKRLYGELEVLPIDSAMAIIGQRNEDISAYLKGTDTKEEKAPSLPAASNRGSEKESFSEKTRAFPVARNLAAEHGIDLGLLQGTGPDGVIRKEDVLAYLKRHQSIASSPQNASPEEEFIPFVGIRRTIAERMVRSKDIAAHVTTIVEVDMTEVIKLRAELLKTGCTKSISYLTFVIKAAVLGINKFPIINSTLEKDRIVLKKYINAGIATAVKGGLIVPVIRGVEKKNFLQLADEIEQTTLKARNGDVTPDSLGMGTFTISNTGTFGALIATPIINQPQSAILWMGSITKKPVVFEEQIAINP